MSLGHQMTTFAFTRMLYDTNLMASDAKVYSLLWYNPGYSVYESASRHGIPYTTFWRSVKRLIQNKWVYTIPVSRGSAAIAWMPPKVEYDFIAEIAQLRDSVQYRGEWLMRCLLDLLVRDANFIDNARPDWMVSGHGSGRLELDRWYFSANVAFEFQGQQHLRPGTPFAETMEQYLKQVEFDNLKAELCATEGIELIHVVAADLSIEGLRSKLNGVLPTIPVLTKRPLIRFIERQCRSYRNYAAMSDQEHRIQMQRTRN